MEVELVNAHRSRKCRFSRSSSLRAMRKQTSQQESERGWTGGAVAQCESNHDSAGTGGGVCNFAICSQLPLSGGRMERL